MRADVVLARCRRGLGAYGIRVEESVDAWLATWTFPIDESRFARSGYGDSVVVDSPLLLHDHFRGCPHCAANSFVQCGTCRRLTCHEDGSHNWRCGWPPCRASGAPSGQISGFEGGFGG